MARVKKFLLYIILLILLYIFVSVVSTGLILNTYKNIEEYQIAVDNPKVEIIESKGTSINGFVNGTVKNTTDSNIDNQYLKIDYYSVRNTYLGSSYIELNGFEKNEVLEFNSIFKYNGVESYKISMTDTKADVEGLNYDAGFTKYFLFGFVGAVVMLVLF